MLSFGISAERCFFQPKYALSAERDSFCRNERVFLMKLNAFSAKIESPLSVEWMSIRFFWYFCRKKQMTAVLFGHFHRKGILFRSTTNCRRSRTNMWWTDCVTAPRHFFSSLGIGKPERGGRGFFAPVLNYIYWTKHTFLCNTLFLIIEMFRPEYTLNVKKWQTLL